MLKIDRLSLRLPPGFEHRADRLVDLVVRHLAETPVVESRTVGRITASPVSVDPSDTDRDIARDIAREIRRGMTESAE